MLNLVKKKSFLVFCLILLASSLGIFVLGANEAEASAWDTLWGSIEDGIITIAQNIVYYLLFIPAGILLSVSGFILDWTLGLEHFTDVGVVREGWRITRDLTNMFFVFALLAIAFATVLKVETYGMKALLPKLIMAALLINFSLVISGLIIDSSQVLTQFFLEPTEKGGAGLSATIADGLNIVKIFKGEGEAKGFTALNILIGMMGGFVVIFIAAFVIAVAAILLIVRVVAIWLLLVLSPLAWLLWIFPATKNLWTKWWQNFLKWVFFAPAYAFFFYLAILTITGKKGEGGFLSDVYSKVPLGQNEGLVSAFFSSQEFILQYIFLIILLIAGIIVAQQLGIAGASGAMGVAKFFGKGAAGIASRNLARFRLPGAETVGKGISKAGKGLSKVGLEKYGGARLQTLGNVLAETKGRGALSPGAWKRAWPARRKEAETEAFRLSAPALQDNLNTIFSLGKEKSDYLERAERQEQIEEEKKITSTSSEELQGGFANAFDAGLHNKAAAYSRKLAAQGDLNDLLGAYGKEFSAKGMSEFAEEVLIQKGGMEEQKAYRLMHDLNKSTERVGQWQGRVFKADYKDGKTTYTNLVKKMGEEEGTKEAMKEANKAWAKMDPQEQVRFTHRLGYISEDAQGNDLGIGDHKDWIRRLPAAHLNRMSDEVKATLMFKHAKEVEELNESFYNLLSEELSKKSDEQIERMKAMVSPEKVAKGVESTTWTAVRDADGKVREVKIVGNTKKE